MSNPRGDTQARILAYIEKATLQKGYPPSVREICDATGLKSTSTVHGHLIRLEKKGLLYRDSMKPRAISVPADHQMYRSEMVNVPILGRVTAGVPILATENIEDYVCLPQTMLGQGEHYILSVRGESMIGAGIMDGDYVVVRRQNTAYNGDIVIAMIAFSGFSLKILRWNRSLCLRLRYLARWFLSIAFFRLFQLQIIIGGAQRVLVGAGITFAVGRLHRLCHWY
jgi:repressor LexA